MPRKFKCLLGSKYTDLLIDVIRKILEDLNHLEGKEAWVNSAPTQPRFFLFLRTSNWKTPQKTDYESYQAQKWRLTNTQTLSLQTIKQWSHCLGSSHCNWGTFPYNLHDPVNWFSLEKCFKGKVVWIFFPPARNNRLKKRRIPCSLGARALKGLVNQLWNHFFWFHQQPFEVWWMGIILSALLWHMHHCLTGFLWDSAPGRHILFPSPCKMRLEAWKLTDSMEMKSKELGPPYSLFLSKSKVIAFLKVKSEQNTDACVVQWKQTHKAKDPEMLNWALS